MNFLDYVDCNATDFLKVFDVSQAIVCGNQFSLLQQGVEQLIGALGAIPSLEDCDEVQLFLNHAQNFVQIKNVNIAAHIVPFYGQLQQFSSYFKTAQLLIENKHVISGLIDVLLVLIPVLFPSMLAFSSFIC